MTEQIGTASLLWTPCNWWVGLDNHTRLHIGWVHIEVIFVCMHHMISKTNLQAFIKKCKDVVALVGCLFVFFRNNFDKIYGSQRVIIISTMYKKIILFFIALKLSRQKNYLDHILSSPRKFSIFCQIHVDDDHWHWLVNQSCPRSWSSCFCSSSSLTKLFWNPLDSFGFLFFPHSIIPVTWNPRKAICVLGNVVKKY